MDLYFLVPAIITQILNPIAELVIPIKTPLKNQNNKWKHHLLF